MLKVLWSFSRIVLTPLVRCPFEFTVSPSSPQSQSISDMIIRDEDQFRVQLKTDEVEGRRGRRRRKRSDSEGAIDEVSE